MMISMAWRNIVRNRRRSLLTGVAVAFAVALTAWSLGLNSGGRNQFVSTAVQTRLGHLQLLPTGYLGDPEPERFMSRAEELLPSLDALEHVKGVSPRSLSEGLLARDNETAPVELIGVDPRRERGVSIVPERLLQGAEAIRWCETSMTDARDLFGEDEELFERWCSAAAEGRFLPDDERRAIVLGAGVAEQLLVSVGDEVTVQVVRAVDGDGEVAGSISTRRLVVTGIFDAGNQGLDGGAAFLRSEILMEMLGTSGPNEIALVLNHIRSIDSTRAEIERLTANRAGLSIHSWNERSPTLADAIAMTASTANMFYFILCLLVTLGVVNATLMSVLERTREFGMMLALGARRVKIFGLVMTEVALLGGLSVAVGSVIGGALETYYRTHGMSLTSLGGGENVESMQVSGIAYPSAWYSDLSPEAAVTIVVGVYLMTLAAGLWPALRASRLRPVDAMRKKG